MSSLDSVFGDAAGKAQQNVGVSLATFVSSLVAGLVVFGVEFLAFLLLKGRFSRIYRPRTYLVPEKERVNPPPGGIWKWVVPVFKTSNSEFIQKCGLDAYFFLRYLRMLLKIFIPMACVILPILLPINHTNGDGNARGLDQLGWQNIGPTKTSRFWAHLILAVLVVVYVCYVLYTELRGYIRLRQAYLTSPQHRLRASATTVLVTSIPRKWLTVEALDGLYDVFPGGLRNIWINRNYDELNEKAEVRKAYAKQLEAAETELIRKAKTQQLKAAAKEAKQAGQTKSKTEKKQDEAIADAKAEQLAQGNGVTSGDPHQRPHTLDEALGNASEGSSRSSSPSREQRKNRLNIPVLGRGLEAAGQGLGVVTHGVDKFGRTIAGGFTGGINRFRRNVDGHLEPANEEHDPAVAEVDDHGHAIVSEGTLATSETPTLAPSSRQWSENSRRAAPPIRDANLQYSPFGTAGVLPAGRPQLFPRYDGADDSPPPLLPVVPESQTSEKRPPGQLSRSNKPEDQIEHPPKSWMLWKRGGIHDGDFPSPQPHTKEEDEYPLSTLSPLTPGGNPQATVNGRGVPASPAIPTKGEGNHEMATSKWISRFKRKYPKKNEEEVKELYPIAFNEEFAEDDDGEPLWKKYVRPKDRATMRLPIAAFMPSLPFIGKQVDTIYYLRKELARLNVEVEHDQRNPEKFPLMNSAFIQFNHQVAAHMACQSVSHHIPQHMAPRMVEISPTDVLWDNLSIKWWERYVRTTLVILTVVGLIITWALPVTFTGLLSQIDYISDTVPWLRWLATLPNWLKGLIQGALPPALLAGLLALLPLILRFLARQQGRHTGNAVELSVSNYFFAFLFIQVFLVVSISSGITTVIKELVANPVSTPALLANNLPKASNYFFSYMILQALSVSAGALVQLGGIAIWFLWAPLVDSTPRQKWERQVTLPIIQWGSFFPVYTNLAAIGLIYSVISPLILIFNIITFALFWVAYRYNTLYVNKFVNDTGGLLFPKAVNQLFTGLYVMELCLIGLFSLVRDVNNKPTAIPQAGIMGAVLGLTIIFQWLVNDALAPLYRYIPITMEDDAVRRDEEFARAQAQRFNMVEEEKDGDDIQSVLEDRERREAEEERIAEEQEKQDIKARRESHGGMLKVPFVSGKTFGLTNARKSWADRSSDHHQAQDYGSAMDGNSESREQAQSPRQHAHSHHRRRAHHSHTLKIDSKTAEKVDIESQNPVGEMLFDGFDDEIEDLSPEERNKMVQVAFQHAALRSRRPVVWIPRDDLGISDDEITRTERMSTVGGQEPTIWISNTGTALDGKGRVVYRKSPPDFTRVDLIAL
ncbi:hypothetical protein B0A49_11104 [Cryomyces minteri]|uniref:DUF221-domain-containing protein n=1 Tax=Cryomyces minteri TaxID=331657 RepID=A0A4U0WKA1_9PEZI|nr:hypothetical protein B0A49_11104 [Cryomyces minteri]